MAALYRVLQLDHSGKTLSVFIHTTSCKPGTLHYGYQHVFYRIVTVTNVRTSHGAFCLCEEKKFIFHHFTREEFPYCHFSEQETEVERQIFLINSISYQ